MAEARKKAGEGAAQAVPVYQEYMNPILEVLRRQGQALPIEELDRLVIGAMALPPGVVAIPHDPTKPDASEASYRMAWARTYLKKAGLLDNPAQGRWGLTTKGRTTGQIDAYRVASQVAQASKAADGRAESDEDTLGSEKAGLDDEYFTGRVGEELRRQLVDVHRRLAAAGKLPDLEKSARAYRHFRETFGPEVLAGLDGQDLLAKMHGRRTKDSLVYWLEFKNDDEFPAWFGSIGGGSSFKFGIFWALDAQQWTGSKGAQTVRLTFEEALEVARAQRDQMMAGARVLAAQPSDPMAIDYEALQAALEQAAPDLAETSWGHKYFSLLFPTFIDAFHSAEYQKHQLRKLLKVPADGRYENARVLVGIARQLGIPLLELAATLNERNGSPHRYWRVDTTVEGKSEFEAMLTGSFAAIGWAAIGDLSSVPDGQPGKKEIQSRLEKYYPADGATLTRSLNQVYQFFTKVQARDLVLAMVKDRVRAIGRVVGGYTFQRDGRSYPHRRAVEWLQVGDWQLPQTEGVRTTFSYIREPLNIVEAEARLLGAPPQPPPPITADGPAPPLQPLTGVVARIDAALQRKRQVILYGPPGTGKTYWAEKAANELAARSWFGVAAEQLDQAKRDKLGGLGAIELCSFHPAYGYEDFLEGYRPVEKAGALSFELRDGIFKALCERAKQAPTRPYFIIIDEINRGDVPRIFGELLTVLEREKRGKAVALPMSGKSFVVPDNVYVIGTMNTADRSIALLDAALRRRFAFVELLPDSSALAQASVDGIPLGPWLNELNRRIIEHLGRDARHLQIGHSYLLSGGAPVGDVARFVEILRDDIVPLLEEYCYEDFDALKQILGQQFVQPDHQRIDPGLFEVGRHDELVGALRSSFHGITATRQAAESEASKAHEDEADEVDAE